MAQFTHDRAQIVEIPSETVSTGVNSIRNGVFVPLEVTQVENPAKSDPERTKQCPAKISTSARNCCPEVETLKHDFGADRHSDAFLIPFEVI